MISVNNSVVLNNASKYMRSSKPISIRTMAPRSGITQFLGPRNYSTQPPKKKKKNNSVADISQIPIKSLAAIADFYIPPSFSSCPISSWHKLIFRRLGVFAVNTYSVVKFKNETKVKLKFNDWKDQAMEKFVRTNKIFAASCNLPASKRPEYLTTQLEDNAGTLVCKRLIQRSNSFPVNGKLSWDLISIEKNPKVISFTVLPDSNNVTAYVQFVMKVTTKQKVSYTNGKDIQESERVVTDNLVYTLNPFSDEVVLVGSLFESDHLRNVQPELSYKDTRLMQQFQNQTADIFRSNPKSISL